MPSGKPQSPEDGLSQSEERLKRIDWASTPGVRRDGILAPVEPWALIYKNPVKSRRL
jgi:hypothetical protein